MGTRDLYSSSVSIKHFVTTQLVEKTKLVTESGFSTQLRSSLSASLTEKRCFPISGSEPEPLRQNEERLLFITAISPTWAAPELLKGALVTQRVKFVANLRMSGVQQP